MVTIEQIASIIKKYNKPEIIFIDSYKYIDSNPEEVPTLKEFIENLKKISDHNLI